MYVLIMNENSFNRAKIGQFNFLRARKYSYAKIISVKNPYLQFNAPEFYF